MLSIIKNITYTIVSILLCAFLNASFENYNFAIRWDDKMINYLNGIILFTIPITIYIFLDIL